MALQLEIALLPLAIVLVLRGCTIVYQYQVVSFKDSEAKAMR